MMDNHTITQQAKKRGEEEERSLLLTDKKREQKQVEEEERSNLVQKKKKINNESQKEVLSTTSEQLFDQAQSLVTEINAKRKNDSVLLAEFKKNLDLNVENCSAAIERALYQNYSFTGDIMQGKLQDLYQTLDRISKLEQELIHFKEALGMLYNDVTSNC